MNSGASYPRQTRLAQRVPVCTVSTAADGSLACLLRAPTLAAVRAYREEKKRGRGQSEERDCVCLVRAESYEALRAMQS